MGNHFRKNFWPLLALGLAVFAGLSETVALGVARRRLARFR